MKEEIEKIEITPEKFLKKLIKNKKREPLSKEKQEIWERILVKIGKYPISGTMEEIEEAQERFLNKILENESEFID